MTTQPSRARVAGRFAFNLIVAPALLIVALVGGVVLLRSIGVI